MELFTTQRLIVRELDFDDEESLFAVYSDPEAMRWVDDGQPIPRGDCTRWIEVTRRNYATRGYGMSAVVLAESGEVVGYCGLVHPGGQEEAEVKYAFLRAHWGAGLATETVTAMIEWGRERFGLRRVIATLSPENLASKRVLEKSGLASIEVRRDEDGSEVLVMAWEASTGA
ncbi:GNAT family N-acetyltransferase [Engelhardtia mirabilis]|uniref:Anhydro-N-acetylmuramic acid kinase n=1 Tax=Engelhardtia mirabilis TaxID=2528011 RepID=A0A518BP25_9BACT|nr:anhydro-N-acetylmuramic acid kinase [Planctomycetes bacterium Pla133]QDV03055.1 anhydro-N-acetylmuramic acid kinase [Planctomycetes bacterium Pla86]